MIKCPSSVVFGVESVISHCAEQVEGQNSLLFKSGANFHIDSISTMTGMSY